MILSGTGLVAMFVNAMWKRYVRLKALEPVLDREWVADCEKHGTASYKGSKVTLKNVRDFTWENKREHNARRRECLTKARHTRKGGNRAATQQTQYKHI